MCVNVVTLFDTPLCYEHFNFWHKCYIFVFVLVCEILGVESASHNFHYVNSALGMVFVRWYRLQELENAPAGV